MRTKEEIEQQLIDQKEFYEIHKKHYDYWLGDWNETKNERSWEQVELLNSCMNKVQDSIDLLDWVLENKVTQFDDEITIMREAEKDILERNKQLKVEKGISDNS